MATQLPLPHPDDPLELDPGHHDEAWVSQREKALVQERLLHLLARLPERIQKEPGQNFLLLTYILTTPQNGEHGQLFPIAVYSTHAEAQRKAAEFINQTGLDTVRIYPMAEWKVIAERAPQSMVSYVTQNDQMNVTGMEGAQDQTKSQKLKEAVALGREVEEEHLRAKNPGTVDHYAYCWYRAIQQRSLIADWQRKIAEAQQVLNEEISAIQVDYMARPELDQEWLPVLEARLNQRGERLLFQSILRGYYKLRLEVLPLAEDSGLDTNETEPSTSAGNGSDQSIND